MKWLAGKCGLIATGLFLVFVFPGVLSAVPFDKGGVISVGARASAMGGAFCAVADDISALWWNPAGLFLNQDYEVAYHHSRLLGGVSNEQLLQHRGFWPELNLGYGLAYRYLLTDEINQFKEQTQQLSVALPFSDDSSLLFGASLKIYSASVEGTDSGANGFGIDAGFLYIVPYFEKRLRLGVLLQDFQNDLNWNSGFEYRPLQAMQIGLSWKMDSKTILAFDSELIADNQTPERSSSGFRMGAERWFDYQFQGRGFDRLLALRIGYFQNGALAPSSLSGFFTLGFGIQYMGLEFDYAWL